jgi:hypothetical protein
MTQETAYKINCWALQAKQTNYSEVGVFQVFCLQHTLTHCAHYQEVKSSLNLFIAGQWNMTDEIYDILCNLKTYFCIAEWQQAPNIMLLLNMLLQMSYKYFSKGE